MWNAWKIVLAVALLVAPAHAQNPKQPLAGQTIAIVEPSGQGSVTHIVAELLKPRLEKALGAQIAIQTVPSSAEVAAAQTPAAKDGAEKSSIPLNVQNAIVLRESMARARRVINDLPN